MSSNDIAPEYNGTSTSQPDLNAAKSYKRAHIRKIVTHKSGDSSGKKIINEFVEWSLLTKFDCYSKIFEYPKWPSKLVWTLVFLTFTSFTMWLVIKNITDFYEYEVISKIEIISERPSIFPAVTICNNDPFTSEFAQSFIQNITKNTYGTDIDNMTFIETYVNSKVVNRLAKMYASSPLFTDQQRKSLIASSFGYQCYFGGESCPLNSQTWTYDYNYGNCYQFNTGYNQTTLLKTYTEGVDNGLSLLIGPLINKNKYLTSLASGMVVFIHNQTSAPSSNDFISVETGKQSNIAIKRTFTYNQASPYSECVDLASYHSDLYDVMITRTNYAYRQLDCFGFCFQREVTTRCDCFFTELPMIAQSSPCLNVTQIECMDIVGSEFSYDDCTAECPLECDSVRYEYSLSSLVSPNQKMYNVFFNDRVNFNIMQSAFGVNLSTYEQFQQYFLVVNVYYPYLQYTKIREAPKASQIDLLSQIGGSLGMFLGFSLFHFVELFEIIFVCVYTLLGHTFAK